MHPLALLISDARTRLAAGDKPHTIALEWSQAVDAADDVIVAGLPIQVGGVVELLDGPVAYLVARAVLGVLTAKGKRKAKRAKSSLGWSRGLVDGSGR